MGKSEPQLPLSHRHQQQDHDGSSFFVQCSKGLSRIARLFSFKCVFILLLSVSVSLSAIFSVFQSHHGQSRFDANDSVKQSAIVQAYFKLEKPVAFLVPHITRLEYDINEEIGVPGTQSVFVLVTNKHGSTQDPPVVVQASVVSNLGSLELQRLKELAEEIKRSPTEKNLGLEYSVFGKVKEISLSSYLSHTLDAPTPTPAPTPSPTPSPDNGPNHSLPPLSNSPSSPMDPSCGGSPGPSPVSGPSPYGRPNQSSSLPPNLSPLPLGVSYGSRPHQENGYQKGLAPSPHSISSSESSGLWRMICLLFSILITTLHIL